MLNKEKIKGRIFDIRRFSIHDGEGIRTTCYLKGCPMSCKWCQNPEGIPPEIKLVWIVKKCINCKLCDEHCKDGLLKWRNVKVNIGDRRWKTGKISIDKKRQPTDKEINIYTEICPTGALRADSHDYEVDELVEILKKDKIFFKNNGGITLSGGEPLYQIDFTYALLKKLKKEKINTAIETALYADSEELMKIVPYTDIIFADFKIFDDKIHKASTGVSNKIIKENIKMLLTSEHKDKVIIRLPLIPCFTARDDNIADICRFIADCYDKIKFELINYNPLAQSKYALNGKKYCFKDNINIYSDKELDYFKDIARSQGVKNIL